MANFLPFPKYVNRFLAAALSLTLTLPVTGLTIPRAFAATYTVTTNADSGAGSLRQAITDANNSAGSDTISIDASLAGSTITLSTDLPAITGDTIIDGTATAASRVIINPNNNFYGLRFTAGTSSVYGIKIATGTSGQGGIRVEGGTVTVGGTASNQRVEIYNQTMNAGGAIKHTGGNLSVYNCLLMNNYVGVSTSLEGTVTIGGTETGARNIISSNTGLGIAINRLASGGNTLSIVGNYIGTNELGTSALSNGLSGIYIGSLISSGTIDQNVISGNGENGIYLEGSGITITRNYLGTNAAGTSAIANSIHGLHITGTNNTIGGSNLGNVISGNTTDGIYIEGSTATGNAIYGNTIGLGSNGSTVLANGSDGIETEGDSTIIGEDGSSARRNIISGNTYSGIYINGADSSTVLNNAIGYGSDLTTLKTNGSSAIKIANTAASNTIGGSSSTGLNLIAQADGTYGIELLGTGGNFNNLRKNTYRDLSDGSTFVSVSGSANESIGTPTLVATHDTPTTSSVSGTAPANSIVDFYVEGVWNSQTTTDSGGLYEASIASGSTTHMAAMATNTSGSSSSTSTVTTVNDDSTAPNAPVLSYTSSQDYTLPATINGTGEAGTSVYMNGTDSEEVVDGGGNFSLSVTLLQGSNSFSITLVDGMSNISAAATALITGTTTSGMGGAGTSIFAGAAGHGSKTKIQSEKTLQTEGEQQAESMAGDTEVLVPEQETPKTDVEVTAPEAILTDSTDSSEENSPSSGRSDSINGSESNTAAGMFRTTKPLKPFSIRDTMPAEPARGSIYDARLLKASFLGEAKGDFNMPQLLLALKLGTHQSDLKGDSDNDGLWNEEEVFYGSNPTMKDSDGDGLNDFKEIEFIGTDPMNWDTDQDFIADDKDPQPLTYNNPRTKVETHTLTDFIKKHTITVPLGTIDTDKDGLCDLCEFYMDTNPEKDDTDSDGLVDGDEMNHYGTDPKTPSAAGTSGVFRLVNQKNEETIAEGEQYFTGMTSKPKAHVGVYEVMEDSSIVLLGETDSDEAGRFTLYTDTEMNAGTHTIVAIQGSLEKVEDITGTYSLKIIDWVKRPEYVSLSLQNGSTISNKRPRVDLVAADDYMIVVSWRSNIYTQTLIADAADQVIYTEPREDLDLGEHSVTWYARDLESTHKSTPTQIKFKITNEAFVNGSMTTESPWTVLWTSFGILVTLAALGLYFHKRNAD